MSARKTRQEKGYLYEFSEAHANSSHYQKALNARNIYSEEYAYQSVFHGPSQAKNLVNEVHQKQVRNRCATYRDINAVVVPGSHREAADVITAKRLVVHDDEQEDHDETRNTSVSLDPLAMRDNHHADPEKCLELATLVEKIYNMLTTDEVKVFSFLMCKTGVYYSLSPEERDRYPDILENVQLLERSKNLAVYDLIELCGSRHKMEASRTSFYKKMLNSDLSNELKYL